MDILYSASNEMDVIHHSPRDPSSVTKIKPPSMNRQGSLFSRIRPGKPSEKQLTGFLALPGEVRNRIYEYYLQDNFRCELAAKGSTVDYLGVKAPRKTIKLCVGVTQGSKLATTEDDPIVTMQQRSLRVSRRLGKYKRVQGEMTNWKTSLCPLILVSKQVHHESVVLLYQKTTFVIDSANRIKDLLGCVRATYLAFVTKLEFVYVPHHGEFWKSKHQVAWGRACKALTKKMVGLRELTIFIYTGQWVRWFDLRQEFVQPLLQLRRLSDAKRKVKKQSSLQVVKINFSTYWSRTGFHTPQGTPLTALNDASLHLHRLYSQAIAKAILGANEDDAMELFLDAWNGRYARWRHHLQFHTTGW